MCAKSLQLCTTLWDPRLQPAKLFCPWDSPGKNTGVGCHALLQQIFATKGWNPWLRSPALAGRFSTTSATLEALLQIHQLVKSITLWLLFWASQVAQRVKNLPAMQETWVQSLGWKDPLEKGRATHSSILAWRIPWRKEPWGYKSMGLQRARHDWVTFTFTFYK